jgi:hypothetical protein
VLRDERSDAVLRELVGVHPAHGVYFGCGNHRFADARAKHLSDQSGASFIGRGGREHAEGFKVGGVEPHSELFVQFSNQGFSGCFAGFWLTTWLHPDGGAALADDKQAANIVDG